MSAIAETVKKHNFRFQQTMLRIKDPTVSVPFYQRHFNMTLVDQYDFPEWKFSLYFLASVPEARAKLVPGPPGSDAAHDFLWSDDSGVTLELTHNWGTEDDDAFEVSSGNVAPHRGFGHIAFNVEDVYAFSEALGAEGVLFQKKPDEGRMKGLAFALDPDGYWIELVKKDDAPLALGGAEIAPHPETTLSRPNLSQTMLRVRDPKASLAFYVGTLGMVLLWERHFPKDKGDFSLYFLAGRQSLRGLVPGGPGAEDALDALIAKIDPADDAAGARFVKGLLHEPILELTHNHGTEDQGPEDSPNTVAAPSAEQARLENAPRPFYHSGNDGVRGFGHIGFLCEKLPEACEFIAEKGYAFRKKWDEGNMKTLAFALDPDGYSVEIIQKGLKI